MKSRRYRRKNRQADKGQTMIFPLTGMFLGALVGAYRAKARGGKPFDLLQWGAVFAILFGIIGLFLLIIIDRSFY
jgi:hypothetical protein